MNRRDFLKLAGVSLLSLAALTMGCGSFNAAKADAPAPKVKQSTSEGASQNMNNGKKILVAYFSWSGKTVAPFFTHGGGGEQRCLSDLQKLTPNAKFTQDLVLSGSSSKNAQGQIKSWLDSLQF